MSQNTTPTTADQLGKFRKELIDKGFSGQSAEQLALDWGRTLAHQGATLVVND